MRRAAPVHLSTHGGDVAPNPGAHATAAPAHCPCLAPCPSAPAWPRTEHIGIHALRSIQHCFAEGTIRAAVVADADADVIGQTGAQRLSSVRRTRRRHQVHCYELLRQHFRLQDSHSVEHHPFMTSVPGAPHASQIVADSRSAASMSRKTSSSPPST